MAGQEKRIDLRVGAFACTVRGFEDPLVPLSRLLRELQATLDGQPALGSAGPLFDEDTMRRLEAQLAEAGNGAVTAVPGLVLTLSEAEQTDAATPGAEALQGLASAAGVGTDEVTEGAGPAGWTGDSEAAAAVLGGGEPQETAEAPGDAAKEAAEAMPEAPEDPAETKEAEASAKPEPEADASDPGEPLARLQEPAPQDVAEGAASLPSDEELPTPPENLFDLPEDGLPDDAEDTAATPLNIFADVGAAGAAAADGEEAGQRPNGAGSATEIDAPGPNGAAEADPGQASPDTETSAAARPALAAEEESVNGADTAAEDDALHPGGTAGSEPGPALPVTEASADAAPAALAAEEEGGEEPAAAESSGPAANSRPDDATADELLNLFDAADDADDGVPNLFEDDERAPADNVTPISSRFHDLTRKLRGEEPEEDEDLDEPPAIPPNMSAAEVAEAARAKAVPELIAASAAWLALVRGHHNFTRREVMTVFDGLPGEHSRSLEAKIKGFGKLVRNGQIRATDDERFALSAAERDRYENLIA